MDVDFVIGTFANHVVVRKNSFFCEFVCVGVCVCVLSEIRA